jgi:hypothetical protein
VKIELRKSQIGIVFANLLNLFKFIRMKNILAILAVNLFVFTDSQASTQSVECEKIEDYNDWRGIGNVKTCYMNNQASIDGKGFKISSSRDENMKVMFMFGNKKIIFLPDSPADVFPNLEMYESGACAIKEITRENFRGVIKLRFLRLSYNQIEIVRSDTFQDLAAIEWIGLCEKIFKCLNSFI